LTNLSLSDLYDGIKKDFERGYLFSGAIDANLYSADCEFTDPTLSFKGLETFQRNIASIKPLIDRFLGTNLVTLYSLEQQEESQSVIAQWRMEGSLKLFWSPLIDVQGVTEYKAGSDGRVVSYSERWTVDPFNALSQLLKPAEKRQADLKLKCESLGSPQGLLMDEVARSVVKLARKKKNSASAAVLLRESAKELGLHETVTSEGLLRNLAGSSWSLDWTDAKGGSSGKLGPIQGVVSQVFAMESSTKKSSSSSSSSSTNSGAAAYPSPHFESFEFVNTVTLAAGLAAVDLCAVASGRPGSTDVIDIEFLTTNFRLLGAVVSSIPTQGKGFWRVKYQSDDVRVFETNAGSLFVLSSRKKRAS